MKHYLLVFILLCFTSGITFAQNTNKQDTIYSKMDKLGVEEVIAGKVMIEEKVVGASRSLRKIEDLPVTVYVITQEDIFKNGYTTLTDVLKMVPGIRTSKVGSGFEGEMFFMRGLLGNNYTKILLNNLPLQPSASSTLGIGEQLPIAQVERIEVIYGSASAVYGSDAMAGVINIITKSTQNSSFASVNTTIGDYGYRHTNFIAGGKLGRNKNIVQYSFYGNQGLRRTLNVTDKDYKNIYRPRIGQFLDVPANISDAELEQFIAQPANNNTLRLVFADQMPYYQGSFISPTINDLPQESYLIGFNIKYKGLQLSYNEMYRADHSSLGRQTFVFGYQSSENKIADKTQITSLNYTNTWNKLSFSSNLMYLRQRFDTQSSLATNYDNNGKGYVYQASDDIFGEAIINYNLTKKWELTGGASYKISSVLPTTRDLDKPFNPDDYVPFTNTKPKPDTLFGDFGINPQIISNLGAFMQGYFSSKKWNVVIGLRYDAPSNYNAQTYSRFAAMYKTSAKTSFRFSLGYAFKAPNLTTSFQSVALANRDFDPQTLTHGKRDGTISYQVLPNADLEPELSRSIELGFRYAVNSNTYLDISTFVNRVQNLIVGTTDIIDKSQYPLASNDSIRTYRNGTTTNSTSIGFQAVLRSKNIIPAINLSTNFAYTFQSGTENLGDDRGELQAYRQVPEHTLQWGISLNPIKKLYFNFDNVAMSGWYSKFLPLNRNFSDDLSDYFIKGYYTLDMTTRYSFNKNVSTFIKVMNVFDAKYGGLNATGLDVDLRYTPQMGRNIQIGVSFKLE